MKISALLMAGCLCSVVVVPALAQTTVATAQTPEASAASSAGPQGPEKTQLAALASQDFGRLSVDGNTAFEDVGLARHAIFDGDLKTAGLFITSARDALERAGRDNTAFQKAEDELMPNKVRQQPPRPVPSGGKQVAWLPIDGELVLDETVEPTSEKTAALAAANRHLKAGNTARASEVLKISGVDADYIIAAVPLEQARQDVARAAKILKNDPYKASEALRAVENAVRYASVDIQAVSHPLSDGASVGKSAVK